MALSRDSNQQAVECPFRAEPCPQGDDVASQCQHRVAQDFDPVERFNDFQVVYCAVCQQHVRVRNGASPSISPSEGGAKPDPDPLDFCGCGA